MTITTETLLRTGLATGLTAGLCAGSACFIAGCDDTPNRPAESPDGEEYNTARNEDEPTGIPVNAPPAESDAEEAAERTSSATDSIADARCTRESSCNNIGADKKYSSLDDCMARIREDWRDDLNSRECPGGVDQVELNECLTQVRNEDCSSPFDTLSRVAECASGQICVD